MEFRRFSVKKKLQVFQTVLKNNGLNKCFTEDELKAICRRYSINAGAIADLIKNLKIRRNSNKEKLIKKIEVVLRNHEIAITGNRLKKGKMKEIKDYSLKAINTSESPESIINCLKNYLKQKGSSLGKSIPNMNLLFYGQPGTGKTEYAKYLAQVLCMEIKLKRASDLISCWVGQTEKLIADAFDEAEEDEAILFLDEADSFFYPRKDAMHSWEKTQTNELLTQTENYNGIMICATNMKDGLDEASLRRFKFKVEFKTLAQDGNIEMYKTVLAPLASAKLSEIEEKRVRSLKGLTPGEFRLVADKYSFLESKVLPSQLIQSLMEELKHKPNMGKAIGF